MSGTDKSARILQAAEEVFGKKGRQAASIAEIARKAEVTDSVVYQYFKNKEDLLFSVPGARLPEAIEQLEDALKGICDATSLLSKAIWFHLNYNELHPEYTRIVLLECLSNPDFYKSASYGAIRQYARIMLRILEIGVQEGVFRKNVNMRLVRDVIFGTLDFEDIGYLVAQETPQPSSGLPDIMALILPMISQRPGLDAHLDTEAIILMAAEKVFAEKGFNKARVSDVAALAGISEATVYERFGTKENLLLSIPTQRFKTYVTQQDHAFEIKSPLRKLRSVIRNHFSLYLVNRDFLKVFLLQIQLSERFYSSPAYETYRQYYRLIEGIIDEGKSEGIFSQNVRTRVFRNMFFGTFSHMAIRWFILGKSQGTDLMSEIDEVTDLLSIAVLTDQALEETGIIGRGFSLLLGSSSQGVTRDGRRKKGKS